MRIELILYYVGGDCLLFDGPPHECIPVPRCGELIEVEHQELRIEAVRYYRAEPQHWRIELLA